MRRDAEPPQSPCFIRGLFVSAKHREHGACNFGRRQSASELQQGAILRGRAAISWRFGRAPRSLRGTRLDPNASRSSPMARRATDFRRLAQIAIGTTCNQICSIIYIFVFHSIYGAAPPSCARLKPRQFLADAGDAGADQGLVTDKLEGQADQDRREGGEPRPLCYLPDGRGRHRTANVPRDFAAHRGATAAATTSASVRRSM